MLHLIKENKELIETIRKILQMFPEGVIIQNYDLKTNKYLVKYANWAAKSQIFKNIDEEREIGIDDNFMSKVKILNEENAYKMDIQSFLRMQSDKIKDLEDNHKSISEMVALYEPSFNTNHQDDGELDLKYYNVKTMKVAWEKDTNSCMHIFIDTTYVKKLEEEKAKYN